MRFTWGRVYFKSSALRETKREKGRQMTRRILPLFLALLLTGLFALPAAQAQQPPMPQIAHTFLKVGDVAPDFTLRSDKGETVKLSDYRGKKDVVLAFYVLAFTGG